MMASSSYLKPGETGQIKASVDVRGKLGKIAKTITVYTNDPIHPVTKLTVHMHVKDRLHMNRFTADELFSARCRGCHTEQGLGKKGISLYNADCAMCHGTNKSASPISAMRRLKREDLLTAIREGIEGTAMPGFSIENSGPLNEDDIASLIKVIKP